MSKTGTILSVMKPIADILMNNSTPYFIPDFQRDFVWGEKEVTELWEDIKADTNVFQKETDELEGYLLGNIVLIQDDVNNRKIVVDGQQRLTTLSLMGLALQMVIQKKIIDAEEPTPANAYSMISDLQKSYSIVNDMGAFKDLKIQHDSGLNFGQYYRKLISGKSDENDILTDADKNICAVFDKLYESIDEELNNEQLFHFFAYYKLKIMLIETTAPTEAKAFQLFEILNDRGRSLEPMDLIKNIFLKAIVTDLKSNTAKENFNENWRELINNLHIPKTPIQSSTFLKYFVVACYGDNNKAEDLYQYFKNKNLSGQEVTEFVNKMVQASRIYANIENKNYGYFLDDINMSILFEILKIKQFNPILILFYNETDDIKREVLDRLTRLSASILFSYNQTNKIEGLVPVLIQKYREDDKIDKKKAIKNLYIALDEQIELFANNVKSLLAEKNHSGRSGKVNSKATSILEFIEMYFNKNETPILKPARGKKASVEHILPQHFDFAKKHLKLSDLGFESESELKNYINRIGNLTLIAGNANSSMGNAVFEEKKAYYKMSNFILTSTLVEPKTTEIKTGPEARLYDMINRNESQYGLKEQYWTKNLIDKRSHDIANLMYNILIKNL
ncbi:DUF262 domain-containing HNH endonuclease family protein [uncultured Megasphaera sp.]|uniref:DUF262 domain-containing protein n=1 Tax=uncultured Megasphaera sp. TaxID=165188 RepID=UPI00286869E9|nr:DUF262 domain-containing HNH endonuclease family protein [uncultured Megasphaera sp.]